MAHRVIFQAPPRDLGKADVVFEVRNDEGLIGTLEISRGSLVWFPSDVTYGHRIGWTQFNKLITENVGGAEIRSKRKPLVAG